MGNHLLPKGRLGCRDGHGQRGVEAIEHPYGHEGGAPEGEFSLFSFLLFRAAPVACGISQARGQIRATAAGL